MGCIQIDVHRVSEMCFSAERIGEEIEFFCSLICEVSKEFYLDVEPEVIWLYPDMGVDVQIKSNVNWYIE